MKRVILVVDDEYAITEVIAGFLLDEGYMVLTADNGRQGLALIREQRPRLVLLDVMMPQLTGLEVLNMVRADPALRDVCIVIMSATSSLREALGADGYLQKPFSLNDLMSAVRKYAGPPGA